MPLRAPRPCFRIDSSGTEYVITHFRSLNRQLLKTATLRVPKGDKEAFNQEVGQWITELPARRTA